MASGSSAAEEVAPTEVSENWVLVQRGTPAHGGSGFTVRRYPELGLRLKLGQTYTVDELVGRCRGDFSKIRRLQALLESPSCFERASDEGEATGVAEELRDAGIVRGTRGEFVGKAVELVREMRKPAAGAWPSPPPCRAADLAKLRRCLEYPLAEAWQSQGSWRECDVAAVQETAKYLVFAWESGAFADSGRNLGALPRVAGAVRNARGGAVSGSELWRPIRLCLTGEWGVAHPLPSMRLLLQALHHADSNVLCDCVPLGRRIALLKMLLGSGGHTPIPKEIRNGSADS